MVIAVYANLEAYQSADQDLIFVKSLINNLALAYEQHQFYLIVQNPIHEFNDSPILFSIIPLTIKGGLFYRHRLNKALERTLKKLKAEVLLSFNALFKISCPQSLFISSLKKKDQFPAMRLQKLKNIFVLSESVKSEVINEYKIAPEKIRLIYGGPAKQFCPLSDEVRTLIKAKYTDGKEYFIYRGIIKKENNIISLLKAFSFFKKRQKSAMKLLLLGKLFWKHDGFDKLISTYKYREDVVVANDIKESEEAELLGAAYAFIQPYATDNLLFDLDAMQCQVPVLTDNSSLIKNIAGDKALYFDSVNDADIAHKLMLVYKDEGLRNQLIEKGKVFVSEFTWKETTEAVGRILQPA